jgi:hypothetical protein
VQTKSIERRPVVGLREIWRLKRALRSISPAAYRRFRSWYWSMRARSGPDLLTVADTMIEQYGSLVLSGPFAGKIHPLRCQERSRTETAGKL